MVDKRICAVSLSREEPILVLAGYRDGHLYVIKSEVLSKSLEELKLNLPERLIKWRNAGFIVLIDELLHVFSKNARRVRLQDIGPDSRPVLVSALETYRYMRKLKSITFPSAESSSFEIADFIVDERRDLSGNPIYHIDWEALHPKQVALLLCVHAATTDNVYDISCTKELFNLLGATKSAALKRSNRMSAFSSITRSINEKLLSVDALGENK